MQKVQLLSQKILSVLARKHRSQRWLAKRLEISSGYMTQLLNGKRYPSPKTRKKIQEHFPECNFDELFSEIKRKS